MRERLRRELPAPGDPAKLLEDLLAAGLDPQDAADFVANAFRTWVALRDLRLQRAWQSGMGWFHARNMILVAALLLVAVTLLRPPPGLAEAAAAGAAALHVVTAIASPLRSRRLAREEERLRTAWAREWSACLERSPLRPPGR